jgi:formylglycine-generating enzyme required for sulfatase activity
MTWSPTRRFATGLALAMVTIGGCATPTGSGLSGAATATAQPPTTPGISTTPTTQPTQRPEPTLGPEASVAAGATRTDARGIAQVWVPRGSFTMGSTDRQLAAIRADPMIVPDWVLAELPSEQPAHDVTITRGFWLDRDEVTNAAFQAFIDAGAYTDRSLWSDAGWAWLGAAISGTVPRPCGSTKPDQPRACVTWFEAEAYGRWRDGSLPTEAQWEYAARGPKSLIYPWGNEWDGQRCTVEGALGPTTVGSHAEGASWVGANDMAGNVMEWVGDWLSKDYASATAVDPTGPATGTKKVEKGGWWGSNRFVARAAYRHYEDPPDYQDHHIGFRVVSP